MITIKMEMGRLLAAVLIPAVFFIAGVLIQHIGITKNKCKKLKIIFIAAVFALSVLMAGHLEAPSGYINFVEGLMPAYMDTYDIVLGTTIAGVYLFIMGLVFVAGCLARWAVHKIKAHLGAN